MIHERRNVAACDLREMLHMRSRAHDNVATPCGCAGAHACGDPVQASCTSRTTRPASQPSSSPTLASAIPVRTRALHSCWQRLAQLVLLQYCERSRRIQMALPDIVKTMCRCHARRALGPHSCLPPLNQASDSCCICVCRHADRLDVTDADPELSAQRSDRRPGVDLLRAQEVPAGHCAGHRRRELPQEVQPRLQDGECPLPFTNSFRDDLVRRPVPVPGLRPTSMLAAKHVALGSWRTHMDMRYKNGAAVTRTH